MVNITFTIRYIMAISESERVWDHLRRRFPKVNQVSVDDLEKSMTAEGHQVTRTYHLIPVLKAWSTAGFGSFTVGRRGSPTRISFPRLVERLDGPPHVATESTIEAGVRQPQLLNVPVPIRPNVVAHLHVPDDLSAAEAEQLCQLLRLLPRTAD